MLEKIAIGWEKIEPVFLVNIALKKPSFFSEDMGLPRQPVPKR